MKGTAKKEIIIVGPEWKPRALYRAQLIEEGYHVLAVKDIADLTALLKKRISKPFLVLVEIAGIDLDQNRLQTLRSISEQTNLLLCIAPGDKLIYDLSPFKYVMARPFSIADVVRKVKEIDGED